MDLQKLVIYYADDPVDACVIIEILIFLDMGGHHVTQRAWTPTKRRGPIAAGKYSTFIKKLI